MNLSGESYYQSRINSARQRASVEDAAASSELSKQLRTRSITKLRTELMKAIKNHEPLAIHDANDGVDIDAGFDY